MLEIVIKIFCAIIFSLLNFYIVKTLLKSEEKLSSKKNIILIILLAIIYIVFYTINYFISKILLKFIIGFFITITIFDAPIHKVIIAYIVYILIALVADLLNACIYMQFISLNQLRGNWIYILLSNSTVILTMIFIVNIKPLIFRIRKFIENLIFFNNYEVQIFFFLILLAAISLFYNMTAIYKINYEYIINLIITLSFFIILFIYVHNNLNYFNLQKEYDSLFSYVKQFEDTIDNMNLSNHEYKNQLAMLKGYIEENENQRCLELINDMTKEMYKQDTKILSELKNIPKGGLKGLLYYKIITVNNNNLKLGIDISKDVTKKLDKLELSQIKILCQLIGIYLDNAIDASKLSKKKLIAIEIYKMNNDIQFVFSNTYVEKNLKINKIGNKGYTTKGSGHGNGIYLSNKILSKNKWLDSKNELINGLYVQKLIIKGIFDK